VVVERFQSDESIPVFLISLKAGGVGLNLTAADTVIHSTLVESGRRSTSH
jgi:SNF2 family DNA or RNA helicase